MPSLRLKTVTHNSGCLPVMSAVTISVSSRQLQELKMVWRLRPLPLLLPRLSWPVGVTSNMLLPGFSLPKRVLKFKKFGQEFYFSHRRTATAKYMFYTWTDIKIHQKWKKGFRSGKVMISKCENEFKVGAGGSGETGGFSTKSCGLCCKFLCVKIVFLKKLL